MEALFLSVVSISITTSIVIFGLFVLGSVINKRYLAKWKYWLWIILALRLLVPFHFRVPSGQIQITIPTEVGNMAVSEIFETEAPFTEIQSVEPQITAILPVNAQMTAPLPAEHPTMPSPSTESKNPEGADTSLTLLEALAYLWAAGVFCLFTWHLLGFCLYKRRIRKRGNMAADSLLSELLQELSRELGIQKKIPILISAKADSPMIMGLWRPILVLPDEEYTWEESYYILKHELIHFKRHDILVKFLLLLAWDLHWFNPFVYLMRRQAEIDMELACDEAVVRGSSFDQREAYTETLMVTLHRQSGRGPLLSTQFSCGKRVMKKRFKNILIKSKKKSGVILFAVIFLLTATVGAVTSLAVEANAPEETEREEISDENVEVEQSFYQENDAIASIGQAFAAVLSNEKSFYCTDAVPYENRNVIYEYTNVLDAMPYGYNDQMSISQFSIVDLDGDAIPEIVLEIEDYYGYCILRYRAGEVYGNVLNYRSLVELKEDGTFVGDGGAGDYGIEKLYFIGNVPVTDNRAHVNEGYGYAYYTIHDISVDANALNGIMASFEEVPKVEWHEFTEDAIQEWVAENPLFADTSQAAVAGISERQRYLDSLSYLIELTYDSSQNLQGNLKQYRADADSYYVSCMDEMNKIYQLCQDKLSGQALEDFQAGQQYWQEALELSLESDLNDIQYNSMNDIEEEGMLYFEYGDIILRRTLSLINVYYDCHFYEYQGGISTDNGQQNHYVRPHIHTFQQEDITVEPEIRDYSFEEAVQAGEVREIDGTLPGLGMGTWYIVDVEGVEYYYANYDSRPEEYTLFGWSIVDDTYELANGLKVGMKEEDVLAQYPDMAVIDFEGNFIYDEVVGFMGWNGTAYPRSDIGMDSDWDYDEKDYHWIDQFDYIMVADITLNDPDTLPIYLGLLIKDNVVAAITFYYPSAG